MQRLGPAARTALVGGLLIAMLATSGCSFFEGDRPTPEEGAARVARALSSGHLGSLRMLDDSPKAAQRLWDRTVAGLGTTKPTVRVDKVSEPRNGSVTARFSYRWRLPGATDEWTYRTEARLTHVDADSGDQWLLGTVDPSLVHPRLADGGRLTLRHDFADRADILGAGGAPLVKARPVFRFGLDKARLVAARQPAAARRLADRLGIDAGAFVARTRASGPKAFVEALVLRPADARRYQRDGTAALPGVSVLPDALPLAPTREFARALLGTVGPVDADTVKKSGGLYQAGDEAGLSGLEGRYDEQLRGAPGTTVQVVGAEGGARTVFREGPEAGKPLRTTLSPRLQRAAESSLSGVAPASAVVAIRPSSGALVAVANGEGSQGYATATIGRYAPGSTFKVVSSLALLRAGVRPSSPVECPATTVVDGKRFKNYSDYPADGLGRITLATAVANSCNTAFIGERDRVSQADIADAAASLGLGVDHDLGFPAYFGSVPASDTEAGSDADSETGHAASMIGQGRVEASPMAMAAVAASVARGRTVVPRLLPQQASDEATPDTPLTAAEAGRLRSLMRGVVTRGSGAFLAGLPGAPALAKTGTAEFGDQQPLQTHAWMIAVHGDLAVAVFVDEGESGSQTAGPVLERFLRQAG